MRGLTLTNPGFVGEVSSGGGESYSFSQGTDYSSGGLIYMNFGSPLIYVDVSRFTNPANAALILDAPIGTVFSFTQNQSEGTSLFTKTSGDSSSIYGTCSLTGVSSPSILTISF